MPFIFINIELIVNAIASPKCNVHGVV